MALLVCHSMCSTQKEFQLVQTNNSPAGRRQICLDYTTSTQLISLTTKFKDLHSQAYMHATLQISGTLSSEDTGYDK
jgi:hypothetical protein